MTERSGPETSRTAGTRPILVTGSHRSGSTWLATMLALARDTYLVPREPFNVAPREYALGGLATHWFSYAPSLDQRAAERAFRRVLSGRTIRVLQRGRLDGAIGYLAPWRTPRIVVKDPIACFSAEWLADRFDLDVVVIVRHPAAFAASLRRLGWAFDFSNLTAQPALVRDHLADFASDLHDPPSDPVERAGLLWICVYSTLLGFADRNSGWLVRTHEQLSRQPVTEFSRLYAALGLPWEPSVGAAVERATRPGNPVTAPPGVTHQLRRDSTANLHVWRHRTTRDEIRRLRTWTEPVAGRFYDDRDWLLDPPHRREDPLLR